MNTVNPIREISKLVDIQDYLKKKNMRDYVLFCFGIYVPIRISDILPLKVRDIKNKASISIREKKTGKEQKILINPTLKKIIDNYIKGMEDYDYLFESKKSTSIGDPKPISRQQAFRILSEAGKEFGLHSIGCHTMRKTFGYHYYQQTKDYMKLQEIFNHRDPNITKRYIGLIQEEKDESIKNFVYK